MCALLYGLIWNSDFYDLYLLEIENGIVKVELRKMKSTEEKEIREQMVDMHQFFIDKINVAIKSKRYIEATWLIYACMENRFYRILLKYKKQCEKCRGKCKCNSNKNELSISVKMDCVKNLLNANVECISNAFGLEQLSQIKDWVKKRNDMMHNLLSLDRYKNTDIEFKELAIDGRNILLNLYESCTKFRSIFYREDYEFIFPQEVTDNCRCGKQKEKKNVNL